MERHLPSDPGPQQCRGHSQSLYHFARSEVGQAAITAEEAMERANWRLRDQHAMTIDNGQSCGPHLRAAVRPHAGSEAGAYIIDGTSEQGAGRQLPPERAPRDLLGNFLHDQDSLPSTILSSPAQVMAAGKHSW